MSLVLVPKYCNASTTFVLLKNVMLDVAPFDFA
jgi:hypothetical protein